MLRLTILLIISTRAVFGSIVCDTGLKSARDSILCTAHTSEINRDVKVPSKHEQATDTLDMSNCHIYSFVSMSFHSFQRIQHLDLSSNLMVSINKEMFIGLNSLETLDLSKNELRFVARDGFKYLNGLLYLDLSDNRMLRMDNSYDFEHFISLKSLALSNILSVNQVYELKKMPLKRLILSNVKLVISNKSVLDPNSIVHMDLSRNYEAFTDGTLQNQLDACKDVQHLNISHMKLKHFDMSSLTKLKMLDVSHNAIKRITLGMLNKNVELIDLDLSSNHIEEIANRALNKNTKLVRLNLDKNRLGVKKLDSRIFIGMFKLETLILSNNGIESLPESIFHDNEDLIALHLNGNRLKNIGDFQFSFNTKLRLLDLGNNHLRSFDPVLLGNLSSLMFFYLDNNHLTSVSKKIVQMDSLTDLFLHCNEIQSLPGDIFKFPKDTILKIVTLHSNPWKCSCLNDLLADLSDNFITNSFNDGNSISCVVSDEECTSAMAFDEMFKWKRDRMYYSIDCKDKYQ